MQTQPKPSWNEIEIDGAVEHGHAHVGATARAAMEGGEVQAPE